MRLIDAYKVRCDRDDFDTYADYIKAYDAINEAPTVDAVPVIRCKDCKHFAGEGMYCAENICVPFDHFYCYYAEREDNATD